MRRPTRSLHARRAMQLEPALGWTYLSREALARAKAQMDEESMGVRDEIGFRQPSVPCANAKGCLPGGSERRANPR